MKKLDIISILAVVFVVALGVFWWQNRGETPKSAELPKPTSSAETQIQDKVREFMADPTLALQYLTTQNNPANFTVGQVTQLDDGGWRTDTPKEWERPVFVFQQTQYIDDLCEVYEYELDARDNQIVDIHVRYPEAIQEISMDERKIQCGQYGSLYAPTKTQSQIETVAMDYLSRDVSNFDQIRSQFVYKPSKEDPINVAAAHEWIWQDTSYKLPDGLTGDVYNYPTIRIILSSGGKLIHYFNSVGLFN